MRQRELEQKVDNLTSFGIKQVKKYAKHPNQIPLWLQIWLQLFYPGAWEILQAIVVTSSLADIALKRISENKNKKRYKR